MEIWVVQIALETIEVVRIVILVEIGVGRVADFVVGIGAEPVSGFLEIGVALVSVVVVADVVVVIVGIWVVLVAETEGQKVVEVVLSVLLAEKEEIEGSVSDSLSEHSGISLRR